MSSVPRTALPGWSRSVFDQMATGLGYFSIALGAAELIAPNAISRAAGLEGYRGLVRAYGVREIATGLAILASHDATPWVWGRVAGDAIDLATVAAGAKKLTKTNTLIALGMLAGVTALDIFCASRLSGEKGGVKTARTDYSNRSGFPKGVSAAKGAARDFQRPHDMRTPEALQPWGVQRELGNRQSDSQHDSDIAATSPAASI